MKRAFIELHLKRLDRKNLTWGVFIMKLTYEDKVQIHELRKQEGDRLKWDVSQRRNLKR